MQTATSLPVYLIGLPAGALADLVDRRRMLLFAHGWGLFRDAADPSHYVETFIVDSWAEHLRQHKRMTVADRAVKERAQAFHIGSAPPTVSHLIYAYGSDVKK